MILKTLATLAFVSALAIALPGCLGGVSVNVQDVINGAKTACSFVPTIKTVEDTLKANPTITNPTLIVAAICQGIAALPATQGAHVGDTTDHVVATVDMNGNKVVISGHYVVAK